MPSKVWTLRVKRDVKFSCLKCGNMYDFSISKTVFFGEENGDETGRRSEQRGAEKERKEKINWRIYET